MNQPFYLLADFSLQQMFSLLLQSAIKHSNYAQGRETGTQITSLKRSLHNNNDLVYASAIALKLAPRVDQPVNEVAHNLVQVLKIQIEQVIHGRSNLNLPIPGNPAVLAGVSLNITEAGLLHFRVRDQGMAAWLDSLIKFAIALPASTPLVSDQVQPSPQEQFQIQHSHARCCSLLRLAEEHRLIVLVQAAAESLPFFWRIGQPDPMPWLTTTGCLQLSDSTAYQLIHALISAIDYLTTSPLVSLEENSKQALTVCQAFQAAYSSHPLLSNRTHGKLPGIFVYLVLVRVTQQVLFYYLRVRLHLAAPTQL